MVIVASSAHVWIRHCNRTNKSNADLLLDTPWQHWAELNGRERLQLFLLAVAAVALVIVSNWKDVLRQLTAK